MLIPVQRRGLLHNWVISCHLGGWWISYLSQATQDNITWATYCISLKKSLKKYTVHVYISIDTLQSRANSPLFYDMQICKHNHSLQVVWMYNISKTTRIWHLDVSKSTISCIICVYLHFSKNIVITVAVFQLYWFTHDTFVPECSKLTAFSMKPQRATGASECGSWGGLVVVFLPLAMFCHYWALLPSPGPSGVWHLFLQDQILQC